MIMVFSGSTGNSSGVSGVIMIFPDTFRASVQLVSVCNVTYIRLVLSSRDSHNPTKEQKVTHAHAA